MEVKIKIDTIAGNYYKWFEVRGKHNGNYLIRIPTENKLRWIHSSQIQEIRSLYES